MQNSSYNCLHAMVVIIIRVRLKDKIEGPHFLLIEESEELLANTVLFRQKAVYQEPTIVRQPN